MLGVRLRCDPLCCGVKLAEHLGVAVLLPWAAPQQRNCRQDAFELDEIVSWNQAPAGEGGKAWKK